MSDERIMIRVELFFTGRTLQFDLEVLWELRSCDDVPPSPKAVTERAMKEGLWLSDMSRVVWDDSQVEFMSVSIPEST